MLFAVMPGQWTPVLPLAQVTGEPQRLKVAGEPVVVFQDSTGAWQGLIDRCPHRGAALSLGSLCSDGTIRCRYHGWRFNAAGECTRVPLNDLNDAALAKIRVPAVPVRELGGALWVYTGTEPDGEPELPDSLSGPATEYSATCQEWTAHWTRAVENFLDFAHAPYVHEHTIGGWSHSAAETGAVADVEVQETDFGFRTINRMSAGFGFRLDWHRPNLSLLHFGSSAESRLHVFSIPLDHEHTRVMTVRRLPAGADGPAFDRANPRVSNPVLDEDRAIVESQADEGDVLANPDEITVATDAASVHFRRWYRDLMDGVRSAATVTSVSREA